MAELAAEVEKLLFAPFESLKHVRPLEELSRVVHEGSARILVDASHTAGGVPLDMDGWGLDAVATSGQAGLFGPTGTGILALGRDVQVRPSRMGECGRDSALNTQPLGLPLSLEPGAHNLAGLAGLARGIRFIQEQGFSGDTAYPARICYDEKTRQLAAELLPH